MSTTPKAHDYADVIHDLTYKDDGVFARESITQAVADARAKLEPVSKVPTFLPILVQRFATEQLTAAAQASGTIAKAVPEILFVCVHNAGRSQMAAAIAEHLAPGKVHVRSAGSQPVDQVSPTALQVLAERDMNITEAYPKPLTDDVVHAADVIVTMGCGDACPVLPGKRYVDWDAADPDGQPVEVVRDIRDDLQTRVAALLRNLNL